MWRKTVALCASTTVRRMSTRPPSPNASDVVNKVIFRSLKDHYSEISKMNPPPKVNPPSPFTVVKGSLDSNGAVLTRSYNDEEISVSVMRMANIFPAGDEDGINDDAIIDQLFVHVDISKPGQTSSLHFFCGLYPEALGIHSVSLRPKADQSNLPELLHKYSGPSSFEQLNEKVKDALHGYIEERGIDHNLFQFLQAWLYVKDHKSLMKWYKAVGTVLQKGTSPQSQ